MNEQWSIDRAADAIGAAPALATKALPEPALATKASVTVSESAKERANVPVQLARYKTASKAAGKIVAGITEIVAVDWASKPDKKSPNGYEVEEPDDDDVETLEQAAAEGFETKFPDANVPWWLGMCLAAGNMVIGVRKTRKPRREPVPMTKVADNQPALATKAEPKTIELDKGTTSDEAFQRPIGT